MGSTPTALTNVPAIKTMSVEAIVDTTTNAGDRANKRNAEISI